MSALDQLVAALGDIVDTDAAILEEARADRSAVSYTHLTLPTNREV